MQASNRSSAFLTGPKTPKLGLVALVLQRGPYVWWRLVVASVSGGERMPLTKPRKVYGCRGAFVTSNYICYLFVCSLIISQLKFALNQYDLTNSLLYMHSY